MSVTASTSIAAANDYDEDPATREGRRRGEMDDGGSGAQAALPAEQSGSVWVAGEQPGEGGVAQTEAAAVATARRAKDDEVGGARARW